LRSRREEQKKAGGGCCWAQFWFGFWLSL
jgi:hypothetical protein